MTKENGYKEMYSRYKKRVEEARRNHSLIRSNQTREYLEYLEKRLKRYTL